MSHFLCGKKLLSHRKHYHCEKAKVLHPQVPEDRCENASVFTSVRASPAEEAESLTKDFQHRPDLLGKPKASGPLFLLHPQLRPQARFGAQPSAARLLARRCALLFLSRRKRRGGCKKASPGCNPGKTARGVGKKHPCAQRGKMFLPLGKAVKSRPGMGPTN